MPSHNPKLRLESDRLLLSIPRNSELLSGMHRIYLVNVLGFEPISEPYGYVTTGVPNLKTLIELIEYLDEQGAHPVINERLERTIEKFRGASADLTAARNAGQNIKASPPVFIKIPNFKRTLKSYQIPAVA